MQTRGLNIIQTIKTNGNHQISLEIIIGPFLQLEWVISKSYNLFVCLCHLPIITYHILLFFY